MTVEPFETAERQRGDQRDRETQSPDRAEITVHAAIVEALDSTYNVDSGSVHGQLCPVWVKRRAGAAVWECKCWHLPRLVRMADAVCAMLDGA